MQLKRLWDTTNKKMVFVKGPTGHECQLWVDEATNKMYYYDMAQWLEYTQSALNDGKTYGPTWEVVDSDDEMGVYDTNVPTELFAWESGDQVSYVFKDWDGTVLKEGKVKEGTKPTAPADPTRAATAQYTYTFAGWNPTVAKITKKTTYTATYTATVNPYNVNASSSDADFGSVDIASTECHYGDTVAVSENTLVITRAGSSSVTVTATPEAGVGYFIGWTLGGNAFEGATVTEQLDIVANFGDVGELTTDVMIQADEGGTVNGETEISTQYDTGTAWSFNNNVLTIGNDTYTAVAGEGYEFVSWYADGESSGTIGRPDDETPVPGVYDSFTAQFAQTESLEE